GNGSGNGSVDLSSSRQPSMGNLVVERLPRRRLDELYLDDDVRDSLNEFISEQSKQDLLRAHGLEPRHRLLLLGPPGNGKTSLAEAIAYELALPLFTVRYDAVVTS